MSTAGAIFDPAPASVRSARRFVTEQLEVLGIDAAVPTAALLVSELVTNAVLHARTPVRVQVERRADVVRVEVADEDPRTPRPRNHRPDSGTGRGLLLVEKMATRWGVERAGRGKVVWFELSESPADLLGGWDDDWEA